MKRQPTPTEGEYRAQMILAVLSGEQSVTQAATALGLSEQRVYQLRDKAQLALTAACEPGQPGRPRKGAPHPDAVRAAALEAKNAELLFELEAARVRHEIALILPQALIGEGRTSVASQKKRQGRRRKAERDGS